MTENRWQKIDQVFSGASELSGVARADYLRSECQGDEALITEVESLLRETDDPAYQLDGSVFDVGLKIIDKSENARTGTTVGHFKIERLIGSGGMGDVYAGEDTRNQRTVAIKFANQLFALDPERIRRFRKEANAASRVSHSNVAKLYELCEIGDEHLIVMELVDGVNLRQYLADGLPPSKALDITAQIAEALVAAHSVGVVHRDIKPENIIVQPDGIIKVLDFGLAKLVDPIAQGGIHIPGGDDTKLTVDMSTELGALMGTPAYMSPEQIRGGKVDTQTDIWSLGVVLYELLTGELPFRGPTKIDLIAAVLVSEPVAVQIKSEVDSGRVNGVLRKAIAKEKKDRYREARELLADLKVLKNETERRSASTRLRRLFEFSPAWKYAAGTILILAALIAALPMSRQKIASYFYPVSRPALSGLLPITDGLVSHWTADGNAVDLVGGNNGELLNGATYRPGISGQAFSFDGVDDMFQGPAIGLPVGNSDRTVTMWVKLDDFVALEAAFGAYGSPVPEKAYLIGATDENLFVSNWGLGVSTNPLEVGRWYFLAASSKAVSAVKSSVSLFVDGELKNDRILKMETIPDGQFYSGRIPWETWDQRRLKGAVDEIQVYNRALSAEEIQALFQTNNP